LQPSADLNQLYVCYSHRETVDRTSEMTGLSLIKQATAVAAIVPPTIALTMVDLLIVKQNESKGFSSSDSNVVLYFRDCCGSM